MMHVWPGYYRKAATGGDFLTIQPSCRHVYTGSSRGSFVKVARGFRLQLTTKSVVTGYGWSVEQVPYLVSL